MFLAQILNANFGIFICCGKSRRMRILATNTLPTSTFVLQYLSLRRYFRKKKKKTAYVM